MISSLECLERMLSKTCTPDALPVFRVTCWAAVPPRGKIKIIKSRISHVILAKKDLILSLILPQCCSPISDWLAGSWWMFCNSSSDSGALVLRAGRNTLMGLSRIFILPLSSENIAISFVDRIVQPYLFECVFISMVAAHMGSYRSWSCCYSISDDNIS